MVSDITECLLACHAIDVTVLLGLLLHRSYNLFFGAFCDILPSDGTIQNYNIVITMQRGREEQEGGEQAGIREGGGGGFMQCIDKRAKNIPTGSPQQT